jgi:hypothetical protein
MHSGNAGPKLSDELKEATTRATNAAQQATAAEAANDPNAQQIVAAGNDEAARAQAALNEIAASERAAKLMRDEMDDQLIESNYPSECRKGIHDFCQLGPMILKGPMVNEKTRGRWMPVNRPDNQVPNAAPHDYELKQHEDKRPLIRRVDPWNFFPDMAAGCPEEREFDFERYLWTASDLRRMVKTHGFDPDAVRDLLREDVHKSNRVASSASLMNLVHAAQPHRRQDERPDHRALCRVGISWPARMRRSLHHPARDGEGQSSPSSMSWRTTRCASSA